eukprot:scaffold11202_cov52-Phaeocystis_antarctica.AAC.1
MEERPASVAERDARAGPRCDKSALAGYVLSEREAVRTLKRLGWAPRAAIVRASPLVGQIDHVPGRLLCSPREFFTARNACSQSHGAGRSAGQLRTDRPGLLLPQDVRRRDGRDHAMPYARRVNVVLQIDIAYESLHGRVVVRPQRIGHGNLADAVLADDSEVSKLRDGLQLSRPAWQRKQRAHHRLGSRLGALVVVVVDCRLDQHDCGALHSVVHFQTAEELLGANGGHAKIDHVDFVTATAHAQNVLDLLLCSASGGTAHVSVDSVGIGSVARVAIARDRASKDDYRRQVNPIRRTPAPVCGCCGALTFGQRVGSVPHNGVQRCKWEVAPTRAVMQVALPGRCCIQRFSRSRCAEM